MHIFNELFSLNIDLTKHVYSNKIINPISSIKYIYISLSHTYIQTQHNTILTNSIQNKTFTSHMSDSNIYQDSHLNHHKREAFTSAKLFGDTFVCYCTNLREYCWRISTAYPTYQFLIRRWLSGATCRLSRGHWIVKVGYYTYITQAINKL